jgi:hypothetical protein
LNLDPIVVASPILSFRPSIASVPTLAPRQSSSFASTVPSTMVDSIHFEQACDANWVVTGDEYHET